MQESLFEGGAATSERVPKPVDISCAPDAALEAVVRHILKPGRRALESRFARIFRASIDEILDGRRTMRFDFGKVSSVEKSYLGAKVEILARNEFGFGYGSTLDYLINGHEVDAKFSATGEWMIAPRNVGQLLLLMKAAEGSSVFSVGVVRAESSLLRPGTTRDSKRSFHALGKASIRWLVEDAPYPQNQLMELYRKDQQAVRAVFSSSKSGQKRVDELFRRLQSVHVNRTTIQTVAAQEDSSKRVRDSRIALQKEGILILGYHHRHRIIAEALGMNPISQGEWVAVRVHPAEAGNVSPQAIVNGASYRLAAEGDQPTPAPAIPNE
ncbi:NaeI family type II restriction endonuclease [Streptomyces sp. NPDC088674]|uniref:NaeI family type II restriction endonuclease n=1 Tax=Streptomyces sp. NPDC088674 TaxID=3365869 RepID=UPI00380D4566